MKKLVLTAALINFGLFAQAQALVKPISQQINTKEHREYALSVSGDGKTCVFAQERQNETRLFMSTRSSEDADWGKPTPIQTINSVLKGKISSTTLTYDGKLLFFDALLPNGMGEKDIYFAQRNGETWSEPKNAGEPLNTSMHEGSPSISQDGKTLYFVREKFEKYGNEPCYTIWVANRTEDGGWTNFDRLPEPINAECEKASFIMPDNRTLIFSSLRPGGKGGFDFYQTELQEDGSWTFPKDMDFINTDKNEEYLVVSGNSDKIYLEIRGDIYEMPLPNSFRGTRSIPISLKVIDALTKQPIDAKLTAALNSKSSLNLLTKNGESAFQLKAGNEYTVACAANGYGNKEIKINLVENSDGSVQNTIEMMPMRMTYKFNVLNSGGSTIRDAKYKMLDLKTNQPMTVDANGSVNLHFGGLYAVSVIAPGFEPYSEQFTTDTKDAESKFVKNIVLSGKEENLVVTKTVATPPTQKVATAKIPEANTAAAEYKAAPAPDFSKPVETFRLKSDPSIVYETKKIYTLNDVYFDVNSNVIKSEYYIDINRLVELMTLNPKLNVQLAGYSDTSGDATYNQKLSERRAKSCADYLTRSGIENLKILVQGFGENDVITDQTGREDKSKSRRVRFIVY
ncbi:MAG: OmpA family protein [Spirosomaceae bacterium]|nr:OmpA family protein [Spirosomataceae bacterium]